MAEACPAEVIVLVDGSVSLLHWRVSKWEEKMEAESMNHFFTFGLFKTGFVPIADDRQERADPEKNCYFCNQKEAESEKKIYCSGWVCITVHL